MVGDFGFILGFKVKLAGRRGQLTPLFVRRKIFCNFKSENLIFQAKPIFSSFILELMPPCALHLILAIHRYLWKFLYDVINKRGQDDLIPQAFRIISLDFLAFQLESYFKRYIYR